MIAAPPRESRRERELRALREEHVVLVDADDRETGTATKLRAHCDALLHRAVSVVIRDSAGALLLQRRASTKYHSPGLWSNSCCGHPRPGELPKHAATRRLREELGLACALEHAFSFSYQADLGGGMHEHEVDHVFIGSSDASPTPNPAEVGEWRRIDGAALQREIEQRPEQFTVWFRVLMEQPLFRDAV